MAPLTPLLVTLLSLLSAVNGHNDIWKIYGATKIVKDCLTPLGQRVWTLALEEALGTCNDEVDTLPDAQLDPQWEQTMENYISKITRQKRSIFDVARIQRLKKNMENRVKIYRCAMRGVGVMDNDNNFNETSVVEQYRALSLSPELMHDIEAAIRQCGQFAKCMPLDGPKRSAIPADVIRTSVFLACKIQLRYQACLEDDIRPFLKTFELQGLDCKLDFMKSDTGRAAAMAITHHAIGVPSYGLYD